MRNQRRERIVRDFRTRSTDGADEGALTHVREAEQADVGHDFELEPEGAGFTRLARLGVARGAVFGRTEVAIASAAFPTLGDHHAFLRARELADPLLRVAVEDDRAHGHADLDVFRRAAVAILAHAVLSGIGPHQAMVDQIIQGTEARVGDEHDVPTPPAITARGATKRDVLFAPK